MSESTFPVCGIEELNYLVREGKTFGTIYLDPPWSYANDFAKARGDDPHYHRTTAQDIFDLPIPKLAADKAHLHLWTTKSTLPIGFQLLRHWGFEYRDTFTWVKPQIGMGFAYRSASEFLLLGTKGKQPVLVHDQRDWGHYPRTEHSEKPREIRQMLERFSPGPYLELFARQAEPGWVVWGNEIPQEVFYNPSPCYRKFHDVNLAQNELFLPE